MTRRIRVAVLASAGAVFGAALFGLAEPLPAAPPKGEIPPQDKPLRELDPFMGDYEGTFAPSDGEAVKALGKVALVRGRYHAQLFTQPGKDLPAEPMVTLSGKVVGKALPLSAKASRAKWTGRAADGKLTAAAGGKGGGRFEMKYGVRKSPTEGAKPPQGAIVLIPFEPGRKTSLDEWTNPNWKLLPDGSVEIGRGNNETKRTFQDFRLHLEFRIPYLPGRAGQGRGNSGVYVLNRYEVQILDSFGLPRVANGCGSLYKVAAEKVNMSFPPLSWQTYEITFRAARCDPTDKKKATEYPRITVVHNGVTVHDDFELRDATGSRKKAGHVPAGPIHLQNHGNPVRFRNIWIVKIKEAQAPKTRTGP